MYVYPFKQVCFFKLNAEQSALTYILVLSSIQYIYIPASNITTQLLAFCCDTALEPDFLAIFPRNMNHSVVIIQRHDENQPLFQLPTAYFFLRVKVGDAH